LVAFVLLESYDGRKHIERIISAKLEVCFVTLASEHCHGLALHHGNAHGTGGAFDDADCSFDRTGAEISGLSLRDLLGLALSDLADFVLIGNA